MFQYDFNSGDIHFLQTVCPQFLFATYLLTEMQNEEIRDNYKGRASITVFFTYTNSVS